MRCPSHLCHRLLGSVARAISSLNPQQSQRALSSASWTPRPLSCTPLTTLGAFKLRRTHLCPRVSPAAIPLLSMAYIYCFFGAGRKRRGSEVKHRGQGRAASTLGFLTASGGGGEDRPVRSCLVPILQSCLGPPWVLLRPLVRETSCFLCPGCSEQKVRSKRQEMGWFVGM